MNNEIKNQNTSKKPHEVVEAPSNNPFDDISKLNLN